MDLSYYTLETLHQDNGFVLCRARAAPGAHLHPPSVLVSMPTSEHPGPERVRMLEHELDLRAELDSTWAVRPLALTQHQGRAVLILEDSAGEPLDRLLEVPPVSRAAAALRSTKPAMELALFLRIAAGLAAALGEVHRRGIIHKNIKPCHVLVNAATSQVWLTGFGIASRLPRERQAPGPPETIAGTLAYMAPEQTGRMNRSIDARSDLYALGVTLYEMLTGSLPFTAADPMEWVHCHIARQARPPSERVTHVPPPVSAIVMKLLAKTAEERYQTASGLERDLRRCLTQLEAEGRIDDFALGERDTPDRLLIPEKLYGRAREIETLLAAFDRIVQGGAPELVLVFGYSGIGKSAVVNELHKFLVPSRGLFAAGKFDQYKRDIPYSTVAQAFQSLVRPLLAKSDVELGYWREALSDALGPNGQLIVDLVPELKLIIGEQAFLPELPPQDAQRRFQLVFRRFLAVFARPEHPLALFLDDLQWLDAATLDLLEDLLTHPDVRHVLLIGAYRDNDVSSAHPLMRTLDRIRSAGAPVQEIVLAPLGHEQVGQFLADSLHCDRERAAPLAELVHQKTAGNPFFVIQFLSTLVEEGFLTFDHGAAQWSWDLARIHGKGYTDNVVDLTVGKLNRLPISTQKALQQLACLGNGAEFAQLALVHADSKEDLHRDLEEALRTGLILASERSYRFLHDRVQEAAYALIPEGQRAEAHLRIGRLLAAHTPPEKREEAIFEIVNQLNRGSALIAGEEREELAALNLMAGKRARTAAAYASALNYVLAGAALLPEDGWERRRDLAFELELHRAACEFMTGGMTSAEESLVALVPRATNAGERGAVACLLADIYFSRQRPDLGLAACLACLRHAGLDFPMLPTDAQAQAAYDYTLSKLEGRSIDELANLPVMTDSAVRATVDVLAKVIPCALSMDKNLLSLIVCAAVNLSLEHGNCDSSCFAYEYFGFVASGLFGNVEVGFRFGRLGHEVVERRALRQFDASVRLLFANQAPWAKHGGTSGPLIRSAVSLAFRSGDHLAAAASRSILVWYVLVAGEPLVEAEKEAEAALELYRRLGFGALLDSVATQAAYIRNLRGLTRRFGSLDDDRFDEPRLESFFSTQPHLPVLECEYWIRKLQARFMARDYTAALDASIRAEGLLWATPVLIGRAEYELYTALARAAACDSLPVGERAAHLVALAAHGQRLDACARECPENFEDRAALVTAEIARIEERDPDAMRLYERAIRSARANGFVQNEALAHELAARFYAARGFETIADAYLRNARHGYLRWGADGKVRQLDERYPHLKAEEAAAPTGAINAPLEHLDLATVIKVSQAVSGEMNLGTLLDTLMRSAIEHAGAERAVLTLSRGADQRIAAEAITASDRVNVQLRDDPVTATVLPETILRYVLHAQENVVLDDAATPNPFSTDPYIDVRHARSLLCLPLANQAKLIGALYLENNLAPHVFTPARIAVLKLLASQAAISLENARLYRDLAERERESWFIVNTIPGLVAELTPAGEVDVVNDQVVEYCGQPLEAMKQWGTNGTVHADDLPGVVEVFTRAIASGEAFDFEARIRRFDGAYRWFQVRGLPLRDTASRIARWYVLLSDIDDRKRAEIELRRAYDSFAEAQRLSRTGSFITDVVGDDHNWSEEAYSIFEFGPATKVTLQRVRDVIHPDDLPAFESVIARAMTGENVTFAFRVVTARGVKHVRGVAHVIEKVEGRPMFIGALQDVTESVAAEEALNRARSELAHVARVAALSALTASIAHEVNQPLSGIITNASTGLRMLAANPPNIDGARETAKRIIRDGNLAADVITRLRALFSRKEFTLESLDLNDATREVIALSASELQRHRVIVQTELAEDLPKVTADRIQLQQVILNFLRNASDAMIGVDDRPRQLLVRTERENGDRVRVMVRDTGVGIDRQSMDKLFDAFYTTKSGGMGIGLSISRSIVEKHHGRLWAEPNDGPGATFSFSIPCSQESVSPGAPAITTA